MNRFAIRSKAGKGVVAGLLSILLAVGNFPLPAVAAESAHKLFAQGQTAEAKEDYDAAYEAYRKAYAKAPNDLRMRTAYYRLRQIASSTHVTQGRRLLQAGDENGALVQFMRATEIDPGNEAALQEAAKIRGKGAPVSNRGETSLGEPGEEALENAEAPAELKPVSNEPLTLHMTQDTKVIYQAIGKAAGINVLFDPDYTAKQIQVDLTNVSLMDALRIVGTMSNTFWRPVTDNTIFVAANTRAKRTELDEQAVQTFYLSNAWQQNDLNDVQTALRNVLPQAKVYGVPSQNAIVMRATPDELTLAQKVINDLDKARPEVVVDVAIMEVDKDKLRNIGLSWPGSISFALQPPQSNTSSTSTTNDGTTTGTTGSLTLDNLANLNATNFAITVSAATANLLMSDSDTKILQNPRIRATDSQKATMKIGSRIPVATGSYQTGATTAITSSLVNTQFQYQDVGVQIEMTPTVHFDRDITLKLKIEDTSESGNVTISGVTEPIIAQKTSEQTIRLREGEASILSGILNKQDIVSASGIPGLGELPLLRYIFGSKSHEVIDDEIVFVLIPHIVREQELTPLNLRRIDTGAGQTIELRRLASNVPAKPAAPGQGVPAAGTPATMPQRGPVSRMAPGVAPLKGDTAAAAVTSAMSQIRQESGADVPTMGAAGTDPSLKPAAGTPAPMESLTQMRFSLKPPATAPAVGSTFPVSVQIAGGTDIMTAPIQIQYDPSKLALVNVSPGSYFGPPENVMVNHRDDGQGKAVVAVTKPSGTPGINGGGELCILMFQAKAPGDSEITFLRHGALDSAKHGVPSSADGTHIVVK
jgi:general secretion pathway protein D